MIVQNISKEMRYFNEIADLQKNAFPPEEQYSMEKILKLAQEQNIEYKSFWENDLLCGILFFCIGDSMLYLFYIAVNDKLRSKGYGTRMLNWLKEHYPNSDIVLNIEPINKNACNAEQRINRFEFYKRNGFFETGMKLYDDSGIYDILSSAKEINVDEYMNLILQLGFGVYNPKVI